MTQNRKEWDLSGVRETELVTVMVCETINEARVVQLLLDQSGIRSHMAGVHGISAPGPFDLLPVPLHPFDNNSAVVKIFVHRQDAELAKRLIGGAIDSEKE